MAVPIIMQIGFDFDSWNLILNKKWQLVRWKFQTKLIKTIGKVKKFRHDYCKSTARHRDQLFVHCRWISKWNWNFRIDKIMRSIDPLMRISRKSDSRCWNQGCDTLEGFVISRVWPRDLFDRYITLLKILRFSDYTVKFFWIQENIR